MCYSLLYPTKVLRYCLLKRFHHGLWVFILCRTDCRQPSMKMNPSPPTTLSWVKSWTAWIKSSLLLDTAFFFEGPLHWALACLWLHVSNAMVLGTQSIALQHTFCTPGSPPHGQIYHPRANWLSPDFVFLPGWISHTYAVSLELWESISATSGFAAELQETH